MNLGQLENLIAEIKRVSFADDKTPLGNALALEEEERSINEGTSAFDLIIFGDLDDFKHLNDDHGHEAGDVAIRVAGETILRAMIEDLQAKAFRPSGDEFVILLKQDLIERFLSATSSFSSIVFSYKDKKLKTAMSFGYVVSDGKTSFSDLRERAEVACQYAKAQVDGACVEWTEGIKLNPLVRRSGNCRKCNARISCNVPEQIAPVELEFCPCCGESL